MIMIAKYLQKQIIADDLKFQDNKLGSFVLTPYDPATHYLELSRSNYFHALIVLRHYVKIVSDHYFGERIGAKNVDLFMLTPSISSPMGPGSDSAPLPVQFGEFKSNLV